MTEPQPSIFQPTKSGVEAVKDWLGERSWMRGTNANEDFGQASAELYALYKDAEDIDTANQGKGPTCKLDGYLDFLQFMADICRGLGGWETAQGTKAIEAAAEGRTLIQAADHRRGRGDD
jgi:hypothetical protein